MTDATIVIQNETNCKIDGLDVETRRLLSKKFSYEVPGARHIPAVKLGRWDGKVTFCTLAAQTYINLLPEIIPILEKEKYNIVVNDAREYSLTQFEFDGVVEDSYSHINWPPGHPLEGQPIVLRDYQIGVINDCLKNVQSMHQVPTGAGKTLITAALSHKCEKYGRTIVIVPNKSLVTQTEADYKNLELDVGVFYGDRKEFGRTHTICTWQSLNILLKNTKKQEVDITIYDFLEGVCCIMVDEAHQVKADVLKTLLTSVMSHIQIRWGLTGTIPKEDFEKRSLQVSIGDVVSTMQASDLQELGVLADCHVHIKQLVDHVEYKEYQAELKYLLENVDRLNQMAAMIVEISKSGNTLVLIDRIGPGKALANVMLGAKFLSGATKAGDRKEHYDSVATNDDKLFVATYGIAAVGINVPRLFNIVLIEPGKSFVRVIQSIGRGLRKAEDKNYVDIYDITSTCKFAKRHLTKRKAFYNEAKYEFSVEKIEWK